MIAYIILMFYSTHVSQWEKANSRILSKAKQTENSQVVIQPSIRH